MLTDIVTIDIPKLAFEYKTKYCILVDAREDEIIRIAKDNPNVMVYAYDTTPLSVFDKMQEYASVRPETKLVWDEDEEDYIEEVIPETIKEWMHYIFVIYIGNFCKEDVWKVIEQQVEATLRDRKELVDVGEYEIYNFD